MKRGANALRQHRAPWASSEPVSNRAWICCSGSAVGCPAAEAGMPAGAGALSGWGGRGRWIWKRLGVSGVVIDSTPGNGVDPQSDATIATVPGEWAVVRHA